MDKRRYRCPASILVVALSCLTTTACVEVFGGSSIIAVFEAGVETAAGDPLDAIGGRPPPGTYYAFYAVDITYQTDEDGNTVLDDNGFPIVETSYAYEAQRFEIVPLINRASPCFIDLDTARFPGIHVTQEMNKFCEQTGIDCTSRDTIINSPDENTPESDVTDVLTALDRQSVLAALENDLKAIIEYSTALPPGVHPDYPVATECVEDNADVDPSLIPPPNCIGEASNARRLEICSQYWEDEPTFYEGSDSVFTLPMGGIFRGFVDGVNPKNQGFLSGVQFYCEARLESFDAFLMNWQYKDMDGDGAPDYPDGFPDEQKSSIGYHYMEGTPDQRTRGTTSVSMTHRLFNITGEFNIIDSLGEDDVHF